MYMRPEFGYRDLQHLFQKFAQTFNSIDNPEIFCFNVIHGLPLRSLLVRRASRCSPG